METSPSTERLTNMMGYPALNGDVVTERHAKYCQDNGHATYSKDGVKSPHCPRCGELKSSLIDATKANIPAIIFLADLIEAHRTVYRKTNNQRGHVETHSVEIAERPTNAKSKREHAIAVFVYKWIDNPNFAILAAMIDLDTMAAMGRTPRWKASVEDWKNNLLKTNDRDYVISQYAVFANYAA